MANQQQELPVNNQTQAVLSKYGITAPKKITNIQNIQNKTETDIKIVQPDIKVSQPNIVVNPVERAAIRYKEWVNSSYEKQRHIASKQKEDLREKEYSLAKRINQVYSKIDDLTKQIIEKGRTFKKKLDANTPSIAVSFALRLLPLVWKPLLERVDSIEKGFRYLFFGEIPSGMNEDENAFSFVRSIRSFLGMDDSEGKGLFGGIGDLIYDGINKLIDYLKIQHKDKSMAVTEAAKNIPDLTIWKNPMDSLGDIFNYLSGLFSAAFGGSDSYAKRLNRKEALDAIEDDNHWYNGYTERKGKFIKRALIDRTKEATYYISDQASKYLLKRDTKEHQKLQILLSELEELSKEKEGVTVSAEFLDLFLGKKRFDELLKEGKIEEVLLDNTYGHYLMNSSHNSVKIGGKYSGKYKTKAYTIKDDIFKEIINIEEGINTYEGGKKFHEYLNKKHESIHGKEISSKAKNDVGSKSIQNLYENKISVNKDLEEWKDDPKYKHWNNAFNFSSSYDPEVKSFSPAEVSGEVVKQAKKDMGKIKYTYGGNNYDSTDCSGYISKLYNKFGVTVPAGSVNIYKDAQDGKKAAWVDKGNMSKAAVGKGDSIPDWSKLMPGDIMLWSRHNSERTSDRSKSNYVGHASLYTGEVDKDGNPIILGHGGPEKGPKFENFDTKTYLGSVRYKPSESNTAPTQSGEKGDIGNMPDDVIKPTKTESTSLAQTKTPDVVTKTTPSTVTPKTETKSKTPEKVTLKTEKEKTTNTNNKNTATPPPPSNNKKEEEEKLKIICENMDKATENMKNAVGNTLNTVQEA